MLQRRSRFHRLAQIAKRLEVLDGYLVVYLNLDEVIRIIREEDDPKAGADEAFKLTEVQADAILNMRLRSLRKLEEMALRTERDKLTGRAEGPEGAARPARTSSARRWPAEVKAHRQDLRRPAPDRTGRRAGSGGAGAGGAGRARADHRDLFRAKGWIRSIKGHVAEGPDVRYKDGDRGRFWLHAQTTDKLVLFATNGRFYTLGRVESCRAGEVLASRCG